MQREIESAGEGVVCSAEERGEVGRSGKERGNEEESGGKDARDWVAYKPQKFISYCSEAEKSKIKPSENSVSHKGLLPGS